MRISVNGNVNAVVVDGRFELAVGQGERKADVWLEAGTHELTVFAANDGIQPLAVTRIRAAHFEREPVLLPFVASDFDLKQPAAEKAAEIRRPPLVAA